MSDPLAHPWVGRGRRTFNNSADTLIVVIALIILAHKWARSGS
jgi:hypothetical protein